MSNANPNNNSFARQLRQINYNLIKLIYLTDAQSNNGCEEEKGGGLLSAHHDENYFGRPIDTNNLINVFFLGCDNHMPFYTESNKVTLK